ncbi:Cna B-type domain-containing protein [Bifidobacterium sp. M3-N-101]|uniref:DUF7604 domain-containing protein n=1 Tax=Bifidobacterium sp. M3-N-101 TaxID=2949653 RepID=UPI002030D704|nr:Cna B-type domain-containing protein [Bifidobacterium sp. M3-N-101]MCM0691506.1 Cna B-type domain-containing protein [Bifidobacterium sp. M3-N-101]
MKRIAEWFAAVGAAASKSGKRLVAVVAAVAMLGGVAGVSATAMADDQSAADTQQSTAQTETPANTDSKDAGTDTGNKDDSTKADATKSDDAASADTDAAASELTEQTAPAPTSTLNTQAAEATNGSCVYAGNVASGLNNVCWLDMTNFTADKDQLQPMSVKLSDSLTMKFNIKYTGGRTLRSAAVPTWNKAAFGHYGYAGFPEGTKPALYQRTGSYNTESTVELTDIKIVNADGSEITGNYSFMMADAESTNNNESISFTSSNEIEQVAQFPQQGDADYKNYAFGVQTFSADHKTVTGGGVRTGANPGIYLYKTKSPDTVSVTMGVHYGREIQAAIFGVLFSNAETTVTTNNASDTFAGKVESQTYGSEQTGGVTGSNSATSKVVNMLSDTDTSEQVKFTLSASENTNWNDYNVSFTCDGDCGEYDATPQIDTATGNRYVTVSVASEKSAHGKWVVTKKVKLDTPKIQKSISKDEVDSAATGQKDSYTLSLNVKGNTVSGTTTSGELAQVFKDLGQIITTTTTKSYGKVSIVDTLSDYADPLFEYDKQSGEITSGVTVVTSDRSNVDAEVASKTYDVATRTVTVTFRDGFTLAKDVTYSVQFKVKPSDKAYETYASNKQSEKGGYTDTDNTVHQGETGTGTDSENKDGFYSNAEAHLAYSECTAVNNVAKDCVSKDNVTYQKPVLQVKTGKIQVTKKWDPTDSEPKDGSKVTVNIYKGDHADDGQKVDTLTLAKDGGWTGSLGNLAPGTYFVEETNVDGYTASYSQSQTVTITADDLWKAEPNMTKFDNVKTYDVTITNTLNRVDLDVNANVKVSKTVQGAAASKDFTFNLTGAKSNAACKDGVTWPKDSNGSLTATASKSDLQTIGTPADAKFPDGSTLQLKAPTGTTSAVYEFTVSEDQSGNPAGWKYDTDTVTVKVTVSKKTDGSGYKTNVEYVYADGDSDKTDNPKSADFTNVFVAVSSLPVTGGRSARDWLIYGGGLGLLALLAGAGYTVWRKRQLV